MNKSSANVYEHFSCGPNILFALNAMMLNVYCSYFLYKIDTCGNLSNSKNNVRIDFSKYFTYFFSNASMSACTSGMNRHPCPILSTPCSWHITSCEWTILWFNGLLAPVTMVITKPKTWFCRSIIDRKFGN